MTDLQKRSLLKAAALTAVAAAALVGCGKKEEPPKPAAAPAAAPARLEPSRWIRSDASVEWASASAAIAPSTSPSASHARASENSSGRR